jgi:hypothetical protein
VSAESRRAQVARWRKRKLTVGEWEEGLPPPPPASGLRTRQRHAKLSRSIDREREEGAREYLRMIRSIQRPTLLEIIKTVFTPAEWKQFRQAGTPFDEVLPGSIRRLHAKVRELEAMVQTLQADNRVLKRNLQKAAADQVGSAYKIGPSLRPATRKSPHSTS